MKIALSTGQVAALLSVTEPRLSDLIRRGKIAPAPPVCAGRRRWLEAHIHQAARVVGVDEDTDLTLLENGGQR